MTDILISGICGHMGRNVLELALADAEIHCVGGVDLTAGELQGVPVFDSFADAPAADAVIDFSSADNLENVLAYAERTGAAAILAATGYTQEQLARIEDAAKRIPLFNGMHRFLPALMLLQEGRIKQIPVRHFPRTAGQSKYHLWNRLVSPFMDCFAYRWMKKRYINYRIADNNLTEKA